MKKCGILLLLLVLVLGALPGTAAADSAVTRIKDISKVQGVRSNQLMGYGLVVGLDGTGDGSSSGETVQSIANMLTTYGITVNSSSIKLKNVAAVMVTATLPPFTAMPTVGNAFVMLLPPPAAAKPPVETAPCATT